MYAAERRGCNGGHPPAGDLLCASAVSAHPGVRGFLLEMQRKLAREHSVIMDGRDIGTEVLPDAEVKIFLTASPEAQARRRCLELEQRGMPQPYEKVLQEIEERDWNDIHRPIAPLRQAEDAVLLDTTDLDFQESEAALLSIIRERSGAHEAIQPFVCLHLLCGGVCG